MANSDPTSSIENSVTEIDGQRKPRILLGACGSVAATKFGLVMEAFSEWAEIKAVVTETGFQFVGSSEAAPLMFEGVEIFCDYHDWNSWKMIGDTVLHIALRDWADIMVIAPLSAHTLAKIAGGLCDNLLTSIVRAWDYKKPMFIAPSMNTCVWKNRLTEQHFMTIDELGISLIPPVRNLPTHMSEMPDPSIISSHVKRFCKSNIPKDEV